MGGRPGSHPRRPPDLFTPMAARDFSSGSTIGRLSGGGVKYYSEVRVQDIEISSVPERVPEFTSEVLGRT